MVERDRLPTIVQSEVDSGKCCANSPTGRLYFCEKHKRFESYSERRPMSGDESVISNFGTSHRPSGGDCELGLLYQMTCFVAMYAKCAEAAAAYGARLRASISFSAVRIVLVTDFWPNLGFLLFRFFPGLVVYGTRGISADRVRIYDMTLDQLITAVR